MENSKQGRDKFMAAESGRPHRKLEVWQRSMALVKTIYELTKEFPKEETYGLSSQMQRSAVSIPSNIACPVKYNLKTNISWDSLYLNNDVLLCICATE